MIAALTPNLAANYLVKSPEPYGGENYWRVRARSLVQSRLSLSFWVGVGRTETPAESACEPFARHFLVVTCIRFDCVVLITGNVFFGNEPPWPASP
ncbi:MAG: hypothetical protein JWN34_5691 [Bryobacterales bacterium]|nr:hypothetical protein [Bryobacterales bacterium]